MNNLHMDIESLDILNLEIEKITSNIENEYEKINSLVNSLSGAIDDNIYSDFKNLYNSVKLHNDAVVSQLKSYNIFLASAISNYEMRDNDIYGDIDKNNDKLSINE